MSERKEKGGGKEGGWRNGMEQKNEWIRSMGGLWVVGW